MIIQKLYEYIYLTKHINKDAKKYYNLTLVPISIGVRSLENQFKDVFLQHSMFLFFFSQLC